LNNTIYYLMQKLKSYLSYLLILNYEIFNIKRIIYLDMRKYNSIQN
jgi:hypothetical protein